MTMRGRVLVLMSSSVTAVCLATTPATAHVQVRPARAAPGDPVLWSVLVPGEQETGTVRVELAVPTGVIPFSFEDAPGWRRTLRRNANGSLRSIVWRGRAAPDGLARFGFLASTPDRQGPIAWKALQTYADGRVVRWIGSRESEQPASVTQIARDVPRENAGGESATGASPGVATASGVRPPAARLGDDPDWVARGLGLAALVAALAAVALTRRRRT